MNNIKRTKRTILLMLLVLCLAASLLPNRINAVSNDVLVVNGEDLIEHPNQEFTAGLGYVKYDSSTKTLILWNATLENAYNFALISAYIEDGFSITFEGTNNLKVAASIATGIHYSANKLNITGIGNNSSLNISNDHLGNGFTGISANNVTVKNANINIVDNNPSYNNNSKGIIFDQESSIMNSNIMINGFNDGLTIASKKTQITDSALNFDKCKTNIIVSGDDFNLTNSKIYSTNNMSDSTLLLNLTGSPVNITNSTIEGKDGTLNKGIETKNVLNITKSTLDLKTKDYSIKTSEPLTISNSTINASSISSNGIEAEGSIDIVDSILNIVSLDNKAAILVNADKLGIGYTTRIILSDTLYAKNDLKISNSPLDIWFFKTSFIANTENELKTDLGNASPIVNIDFKRANYDGVNETINSVPQDLSIYTYASIDNLNSAINAVVKNLKLSEQKIVDQYAIDIRTAIDNLEIKPKPIIIDGDNQTIEEGNDAVFRSNADIKDFLKVIVDGIVVDAINYDIRSGSTIITLKNSYLNSLSKGSHTIGIVSKNGTAMANFSIKMNSKPIPPKPVQPVEPVQPVKPEVPNTGIINDRYMLLSIMLLSGEIIIKQVKEN